MPEGFLVLISGPSGSGKSTICRKLRQRDRSLGYSISYTTRKRRPSELDGTDYFFVSQQEFASMRRKGAFLETATVHGHLYGTPRAAIDKEVSRGGVVLMDIDVIGAETIRRKRGNMGVSVFLLPPTWNTLEERLRSRKDTHDTMRVRMTNARTEFKQTKYYTYWVINDSLNTAVKQIEAIIMAERLKPGRHTLKGTKLARLTRG